MRQSIGRQRKDGCQIPVKVASSSVIVEEGRTVYPIGESGTRVVPQWWVARCLRTTTIVRGGEICEPVIHPASWSHRARPRRAVGGRRSRRDRLRRGQ